MEVCNPNCVTDEAPSPDWQNECDLSTRPGGIPRLSFLVCDPNLEFPYENGFENTDNLQALMCDKKLYFSPEGLGNKDKGSTNTRRLSSCAPEQDISGSKTIQFVDANADNDGLLDYDFYIWLKKNKKFLKFGWVTCNDLWYQYNGEWNGNIDDVIEQTSEDLTLWDSTITMSTIEIIKPIHVPGLLDFIRSFQSTQCYT